MVRNHRVNLWNQFQDGKGEALVQWTHGDVWDHMDESQVPSPSNPSRLSVWRGEERKRRSDCFGSLDSVGVVTGLEDDDELRCGYEGSRLPVGGSLKVTSGRSDVICEWARKYWIPQAARAGTAVFNLGGNLVKAQVKNLVKTWYFWRPRT